MPPEAPASWLVCAKTPAVETMIIDAATSNEREIIVMDKFL